MKCLLAEEAVGGFWEKKHRGPSTCGAPGSVLGWRPPRTGLMASSWEPPALDELMGHTQQSAGGVGVPGQIHALG